MFTFCSERLIILGWVRCVQSVFPRQYIFFRFVYDRRCPKKHSRILLWFLSRISYMRSLSQILFWGRITWIMVWSLSEVFSWLFFFYFVVILLKRISIHQGFVYRCVFIAFLLCLRLPWCRIPFFSGSTYDTYFESTLFSLSHDVYLCCRAEFPNNNFTHRKTCYIVAFPHGWKPTI